MTEVALPTSAEMGECLGDLSCQDPQSLWDQLWDVIFVLVYPGERLRLELGLTSLPYLLINFWKNFLNKLTTQSGKYFEEILLAVYGKQGVG